MAWVEAWRGFWAAPPEGWREGGLGVVVAELDDHGAPVTATGTVTPATLTLHLEVEGSPEHTSDVVLEPTDFGEDDDCWLNG